MMDNLIATDKLLRYWNDIFNKNGKFSCKNALDKMFDEYLLSIDDNTNEYAYTDKVRVCLYDTTNKMYNLYKCNDDMSNIQKHAIDKTKKRQLFDFMNDASVIITNFPLMHFENKICLRYEFLINILTSSEQFLFFDKNLFFSKKSIRPFFCKKLWQPLVNNRAKFEFIKFSSFLLNHYENGTNYGIVIKPTVKVSQYGRWYWSNTIKIQNNSDVRRDAINILSKAGDVVNLDLISGEPTILSQLSRSKSLKSLISLRIKLNQNGKDNLSKKLKEIMNISIHSVESPLKILDKVIKNDNSCSKQLFDLKSSGIFDSLQDELECYNNTVIDSYVKNMSMIEQYRRVINPFAIIMTNYDIIKEHRKYLQGLVNDRINNIAFELYKKHDIMPIFSVHDSLCYVCENVDSNKLMESIMEISKSVKAPISVEKISKNGKKEKF